MVAFPRLIANAYGESRRTLDMHPELLALMQKFELCYALADSNPQIWLATQLLPPAKSAALFNDAQPDLVLRYHYEFMPKGLVSRLIVRQHSFVRNPEMAWVTGAVFERDVTAVQVEVSCRMGTRSSFALSVLTARHC